MTTSGNFSIDPDSLRAASKLMNDCAEHFSRSVNTLSSAVTGGGSPWGSDDAGTLFGSAYTEVTQLGLEALANLGDGLNNLAEALGEMGNIIETTDTGQSQAFQKSGGASPP
jgi:uncharacterized protein YukE